jgi:hypothetical protein
VATCESCGNTILFGGKRLGSLRYCNQRCLQSGTLRQLSLKIPDAQVREVLWKVHQGACPKCGGSGPVDVHKTYEVRSMIVVTKWCTKSNVSCLSCGKKAQFAAAGADLFFGWWGFPWGPIFTPVQIARNLIAASQPPDPSTPSAALEKSVRLNMLQRAASAATAGHSS